MRLWVSVILTALISSTPAKFSRSFLGLENEALIVKCPRQGKYPYSVDWYYSKTNKSITTQRGNRIVASGKCLKFLPAKVNDSGFYTCVVRCPTSNKTGYVNVTIFEKQSDCNVPDYLIYSTTFGSEKKSLIFCPTIDRYNWTQPVEWFKNCEVLQGPRYLAHKTFLLIHNATNKDTGDYTCKFMHNEYGVKYIVTATRSFTVTGKPTNITCLACFGKGHQVMAEAFWRVNGSEVKNFSETRIQVMQELMQSGELTCRRAVLKIEDVREEDLTWKYDCLAMNFHGFITHTITLRRKNPMDQQSTYYMLAGFSLLLLLINGLVIILKVFWIEIILFWRDIARPSKTRNDGKIYDAYVIYPRSCKNSPEGASSVEYFVHQILPDVLENKCGYNLCIYGRDLLPGQDVASTVETSIRMSRRHLFILTAEILHSKEFTYEREIALHSALIQQDSKAILIEMEALCPPGGLQLEELQDSLKHLIKVQGTIKWREDDVANRRSLNSKFWKHVRYHMPPAPSRLPRKTPSLASLSAQG
ncbi:interleukin-1 receptor-like 1 isoform 2-T2 [Dama dama]|uniref:interleukin-1 receptor-like 1 isoform X2 n=1 Tax=Dama dama TaxID=30532 RepID=UPI002A36AED3|nr:interleukin-1 receptor-like 1 isoform X2 [Dama dama]